MKKYPTKQEQLAYQEGKYDTLTEICRWFEIEHKEFSKKFLYVLRPSLVRLFKDWKYVIDKFNR